MRRPAARHQLSLGFRGSEVLRDQPHAGNGLHDALPRSTTRLSLPAAPVGKASEFVAQRMAEGKDGLGFTG